MGENVNRLVPSEHIDGLEKKVSRIVYGTATKTMTGGQNADDMLDAVVAAGINTFDTAIIYGESECVLGEWVRKRNNRESLVILTKGCHHNKWRDRVTPYDLLSDFHTSLARLQMDYIDIYLLHRDDAGEPVGAIVETLNQLKAEKKVRLFGGSNWTYERIQEANEYAYKKNLQPFSISSPCYSLTEQIGDPWGGSVHLSGPSNACAQRWYQNNQMPVFAYSGLARGFLSGKFSASQEEKIHEILSAGTIEEYYYPENMERLRRVEKLAGEKHVTISQIALSWLLHTNERVFPIISPSTQEHLESNLKALSVGLSESEHKWLNLGV